MWPPSRTRADGSFEMPPWPETGARSPPPLVMVLEEALAGTGGAWRERAVALEAEMEELVVALADSHACEEEGRHASSARIARHAARGQQLSTQNGALRRMLHAVRPCVLSPIDAELAAALRSRLAELKDLLGES